MDLWKLLILGIVAVGLALVLLAPPELPKLPEGLRAEQGTFRITDQAGTREELFGIYPVDAGFRVVSIVHKAGKVLVEADLLFATDFSPLAGTITQRQPQEARWIFAFSSEEVLIRKQLGAKETLETVKVPGQTFPVDEEMVATWEALFRAAPPSQEIHLLDIRKNTVHRATIHPRGEARLSVLGRAIPVERLALVMEDTEILAFRQGDLLVGVLGEGFQTFLVEILPEGVREL